MIPTWKAESLAEAEKYVVEEFEKKGSKPKFQKLDYEILQTVKNYMEQNNIKFQFVPQHINSQNKAERE